MASLPSDGFLLGANLCQKRWQSTVYRILCVLPKRAQKGFQQTGSMHQRTSLRVVSGKRTTILTHTHTHTYQFTGNLTQSFFKRKMVHGVAQSWVLAFRFPQDCSSQLARRTQISGVGASGFARHGGARCRPPGGVVDLGTPQLTPWSHALESLFGLGPLTTCGSFFWPVRSSDKILVVVPSASLENPWHPEGIKKRAVGRVPMRFRDSNISLHSTTMFGSGTKPQGPRAMQALSGTRAPLVSCSHCVCRRAFWFVSGAPRGFNWHLSAF